MSLGKNVNYVYVAQFVTESVEAVFLCPTGIAVFTRCGLAADLSFFIDFYSLTLFAAGGLNNPTSIVGNGRCVWQSWLGRFAGRRYS